MQMLPPILNHQFENAVKSGDAECFDSDVRDRWSLVRTRADAGQESDWDGEVWITATVSFIVVSSSRGGLSDQLGTRDTGNINAPVPSVTQQSHCSKYKHTDSQLG